MLVLINYSKMLIMGIFDYSEVKIIISVNHNAFTFEFETNNISDKIIGGNLSNFIIGYH